MTAKKPKSLSPNQAKVAYCLEKGGSGSTKWRSHWERKFPQGDKVLKNMQSAGLIVIHPNGELSLTHQGHRRLAQHKVNVGRYQRRWR